MLPGKPEHERKAVQGEMRGKTNWGKKICKEPRKVEFKIRGKSSKQGKSGSGKQETEMAGYGSGKKGETSWKTWRQDAKTGEGEG